MDIYILRDGQETGPYSEETARTLLDQHYGNFDKLLMAVAKVLAEQVKGLPCAVLQVDEANIPGNPKDAPMAAKSMNVAIPAIGARRSPTRWRQLPRATGSRLSIYGKRFKSTMPTRFISTRATTTGTLPVRRWRRRRWPMLLSRSD